MCTLNILLYMYGYLFTSISVYTNCITSSDILMYLVIRCVELDCWPRSDFEDIIITHGNTLCTKVPFKVEYF